MKPIHFLITGAGFGNSGAQSMMFSLVDELSSRFADCKITIENTSSLPSKFEDIVRFKYVMTGVGEIYSDTRKKSHPVKIVRGACFWG